MFNKGSEWRKWDLHIHTPESGMSNNFGGNWDEYVKVLFQTAIENDVAVLGITDYFTIDGYKKIKNDYLNNETKLHDLFDENEIIKIKNIRLFPNIEFRLKTIIGTSRVNYHIIFSDEVSINDIEENFLHDIEFTYEHYPFEPTNKSKLKRNNLIELGAKLKKEQPTFTKSNFEVGCQTAVVDDEQIRKILLTKKNKFNDKYIIAIPVDEDLSDISWKGQDHNVRKNYLQLANAFFATNQKTIDFGLGKKHTSEKKFLEEFKSLKPCLCGCDAHSCDEIKEWLGKHILIPNASNSSKNDIEKKITWIKADTTFKGFMQILYEPKERVFIGKKPPTSNKDNYLSSINVPGTYWFPDFEMPLNKGLISIIGPRGSGKTALLDLISIGLNSYEGSDASFIAKADNLISKLNIRSKFNDGNEILDVDFRDNWVSDLPSARYLSQQFVEKLCSSNGAGKRLITEIENFIFYELEEFQRKGTANFTDLRNDICLEYENEITELIGEIELCSNEVTRISDLKNSVPLKNGEIDALEKEIKAIILPKIDNEEKYKTTIKQNEFTIESQRLTVRLKDIKAKIDLLDELHRSISQQNQNLFEKGNEFINRLSPFNLTEEEKSLFLVSYSNNVFDILSKRKEKLVIEYNQKLGNTEKPEEKTYYWYKKELENIVKGLENISMDERKYITLNKQIQEKSLKKQNIKDEIDKINKLDISYQQNKRLEKYKKVFESISKECLALSELYSPLEKSLKTTYDEDIPLSFYIRINVNLKDWIDRGNEIIDSRNKTKLKDDGGLYEVAKKYLYDSWKSGNPDEILIKMKEFIDKYITHEIRKLLGTGYTTNDLAKWLFSTSHITIDYDIKYEGVSIEKLSPGTRGIVLMILFLKVDRNDIRPLLIDQPEDNLDPASVYEKLVPYFIEARKRRQIIMVTHNPNLVVGADSDQIIVANSTKKDDDKLPVFSYIAGGLENKLIIEKVCSILEGGVSAFELRKKRYFKN
ncbi:DNA repair ATPase [Spirochaetia bacterium]|nr:DNA repair ATPase [Spirochaetia bacterium]